MSTFDPRRLALARRAAGKTKSDLARDLGLSPASVSQYEAGNTVPRRAVVARMALVLGVHPRYLERAAARREITEGCSPFFRSLRATLQRERDEAEAISEHAYDLVTLLEARASLPPPQVPSLHVSTSASRAAVEAIAGEVREQFDLAAGRPIANVVRLLESRGAFVCRPPAISARVDAFSRWFQSRPMVFLSDGKQDKARSRFDAAHELGHLVMHHEPDFSHGIQERQAHAFAAALLMPAKQISDELPRRPPRALEWDALVVAQRRWGVSIAALLYRAKELGTLSPAGHRRAMTRYNQLGLGDRDGSSLGTPEEPRLLDEAVRALMDHHGWTVEDLAEQLCFTPRQLKAVLGPMDHEQDEQPANGGRRLVALNGGG